MGKDEGRLATRQARHVVSATLTVCALVNPRGVAMYNSGSVDISGLELLFPWIIAGPSLPVNLCFILQMCLHVSNSGL